MKQIKDFLKKFYILRFLRQWILKVLYSTDENKKKYIQKYLKKE